MTKSLSKPLTLGVLLLPPAIVYAGLVIWPMIQAIIFSLYRWNGLGPLQQIVGLGNFSKIVGDEVFRGALSHNLIIIALSLGLQLPISLGLALLVNQKLAGRSVFRTIFFMPFVLSEVITGLIWSFIYLPDGGLINTLGGQLFGMSKVAWLGNISTVLLAIWVVLGWKYFGYHLVLYLTGLQNIPQELHEAALVDGATNGQVIRHITLPLLGPTVRLTIYLAVLGSLQVFDLVWVMTTGGPVNASDTMATYLYRFGFQRFQLGYGSAVALIMFILCFGFSLIYQRYVMRRDLAL